MDASPIVGEGENAAKLREVLPKIRKVFMEQIPVRRPAGALDADVSQVLGHVRAASKTQLNTAISTALLHSQLLFCPAAQPEAGGASGT